MFAFAPDTKIKTDPIKFGRGDWTCVVGEMEGAFSQPMPVGNGKTSLRQIKNSNYNSPITAINKNYKKIKAKKITKK